MPKRYAIFVPGKIVVIVVADSSPINYLVLIEQIHLLTDLFGDVVVPEALTGEPKLRAMALSSSATLRISPFPVNTTST